jgi:hypothetical protein
MALDASPWGGDSRTPVCRSCGLLIVDKQSEVTVAFDTDPDGSHGFTGAYHRQCSKPFAAPARVINLKPFGS